LNLDLIPLISFVIITTFTPGPNNISSASMGVLYGYKKTLNYLAGITSGFFVVLIICAFLSSTLLTTLPVAEKYLRWVGAVYILWLAIGSLRLTYSFSESDEIPRAFTKGFLLQIVNPKAVVYGLTLFSTFLAPIANRPHYLAVLSVVFAITTFIAVSTWALCGAAIKNKLINESFRKMINAFLALLLVYTAIELSGVLK